MEKEDKTDLRKVTETRKMSASRHQTVVLGEASETDSEEEVYLSSITLGAFNSAAGLKVPGEASETDDEGEGSPSKITHITKSIGTSLPPLIVIRNEEQKSPIGKEKKLTLPIHHQSRYSTLVQQKLLESNARLYHDVSSTVKQVYWTAAKELWAIINQFSNSQSGIINASHSIRLILDDLRTITEKIDIITSCNLLPDIRVDPPQA
ncbi:biogenesis of lysosome-related organelles complex 1 subunit 3 [Rhinatrema bivittatum]|uniref:biogenesis of lysosome-related organelles complex 1 subunit 3 n=1 Tax=Rhinatrema bivittatum TaxID=194408 RepID=UPI00112A1CD4|nr:biogenesis of lysosome-related organelles complex 1 subunit 3 [Rhinatrema bivittatum]XP_029426908.1 biogenesis of lysosome-related organelles complex 1 subunit 3 [Rhinatrema bivittatum]XP_029426909.1 biogenesis of lysosome-related organelles complex 1 subunit 3 [Rhinatrema bivittatum]XP_029426910.1 biogenesis of lysosome-related organelles complex 1 subunit 3 [Rhinatrema bivittatum]XP_029426911.1 biogenesis of lysosome-related organelles complex 1 subunit 3 [Rhinatrema bivittatum]